MNATRSAKTGGAERPLVRVDPDYQDTGLGRARAVFVIVLTYGSAVLSACSTEPAIDVPLEQDSVGVAIVTNPIADSAGLRIWQLDEPGAVRIGAVEGEPAYQLNQLGAVLRVADGSFVIVNGTGFRRRTEMRFYDDRGTYLRTAGRAGEGPGDFQDMAGVVFARDTLFAYDPDLRRVSFWTATGGYLGLQIIPELPRMIGGAAALAAIAADGRFVFFKEGNSIPRRDPYELFWYTKPNLAVTRDGTRADTLGESGFHWLTGDQQIFPPPFGRSSAMAADSARIVVTHGDRYEVEVWSIVTSTLERIIRVDRHPPPLDPAEFERAVEERSEMDLRAQLGAQPTAEARAGRRRLLEHLEPFATKPAYTAVRIDATGQILARPWSEDSIPLWDVFDAAGRLVAKLAIPASLSVRQVGPDFLLATYRDSLGVEYVASIPLRR
jgi:hypothetical protein